jgi:LPXTG-motif cell wall-anchored protein
MKPPTRRSLRKALKRQAAQPGTGRTSGPTQAGQLPNTGHDELPLAALGFALVSAGAGLRRLGAR